MNRVIVYIIKPGVYVDPADTLWIITEDGAEFWGEMLQQWTDGSFIFRAPHMIPLTFVMEL